MSSVTPVTPPAPEPVTSVTVAPTTIEGLLVVTLPLHEDGRGWFKENWQRAKMTALGLPDFGPVQHNVSYNATVGTTRGIHAEPWDKLMSVVTGEVFGVWVDLRPGPAFGTTVCMTVGPDRAVFVPRGVGNAFQTLQPDTAYSYLVNEHWSADARSHYTFVNLADETLAIPWPVPLDRASISAADRDHPRLGRVSPMVPRRRLIIGGDGQLGRALRRIMPDADHVGRSHVDLADPAAIRSLPWADYDVVINAAAYTFVDLAETDEGRRHAWAVNAAAVATLAAAATEHRATLVHVSTDYVFDGTQQMHTEDEPLSPLGVYGQSKAAGDLAAASCSRSYVVRTSWVVGDGPNFVRTMSELADRGASPSVVDDQLGRLTFADDLAMGIAHLLDTRAPYGTYNVTNGGPVLSWAELARAVFVLRGRPATAVTPCSTQEFAAGRATAPRPRHSALDLAKVTATGWAPPDGMSRLAGYVAAP